MTRLASVFGIAAALLAASPVQAQRVLQGAELQRALTGKSLSLSCVDGTRGTGRYTMGPKFGTVSGTYQSADGRAMKDVGQVRASGDQLCLRFKMLNGGEENCFGVRESGKGQFVFTVAGGLVPVCNIATR
jgi:hypothetical protein